ncbi:tetratricopeptide repeat protein [Bdellovibrio sp. HCB290]|uniref:tetratricopeptide repeat protein n=1 Tax=Bdellovibrio sp. HCB290 TaxID=3394356 RepID=UPI0039B63C3C
MNTLRNVILAGCLCFGLVANAVNNKVNGFINFQGDTVHLELLGQQNWDYDVKRLDDKGQTIVRMTVPALDESTIKSLNTFKSDMVTKVSVDPQGADGKSVVSFTLSGENIETFDYLTDQPSRLIMDFYLNPNMVKAAKKLPAKKTEPTAKDDEAKAVKTAAKSKTGDRKPATSDALAINSAGPVVAQADQVHAGIFDGGDPHYERFSIKPYDIKEDSIIRAKDNYYISFPMLETPVAHWEKLKVTPTIYEVTPKPTDENKQARLLLTLFEKERYGVFLKTRDWFLEKYPKSEYNEIVDFMTGDVNLALYNSSGKIEYFDEAIQKYKEAIEKYPKSPLAERTSLKIGYLTLDRGDNLAALRLFNEHIENKNFGGKDSISKDLARMGMGLAYSRISKWDDAVAQFNEIEKSSNNRDLKIEAAFRRGDVWVRAKNYAKSIEEYKSALKKYPEGQSVYPSAFYNQAESMFGLKQYPQSLDMYREFVKKFPSSDHAPYAMTRLGELLDILGADKSRVMGAYLETYFRYGETPSAVISRLRLLSARMKGMKPKETANAVKEIMELAKKVDLPNMEQFATVMVADGYSQRDEFDKSINLLSKYYQEHPGSVDVPLITGRIISNINAKLDGQVEKGEFIGALKTHSEYSDNWLKNSHRLDTKYNVGRAFEMAGTPTESARYYKDVLNRVYAMAGTQEAKEINVKEQVPSVEELNLRLAAVSEADQKYNQAYEYLKNIKNPEKLTEKEQIERVGVAVRLLERRGDTDSAVRYLGELLRTWKGQPELVAEPYLRLSELQLKQGKKEDALQALNMIDKLMVDSKKVSPVVHAKALEMMGNTYLESNQKDKAISAYGNLLEQYEDKRPLSSIRYKLGQIYFNRGDVQKAAEVWNEFKGQKSGFWKNLAQEQLKNSEWRDGYKKYIQRIPAMAADKQDSK